MDDWSYPALAERYGVTITAVRRVCDREFRLKLEAKTTKYAMSGVCANCGKPRSKYHTHPTSGDLCRECWAESKQTRFLLDAAGEVVEVRCGSCKEWKAVDQFSHSTGASRGLRGTCRSCDTAKRQNYRERHKEPCVDCGSPALPPSEKKSGAGRGADFPRCWPCYLAWRNTPAGRAVSSRAARKAQETMRARGYKPTPPQVKLKRCRKGHFLKQGRKVCDECIRIAKEES